MLSLRTFISIPVFLFASCQANNKGKANNQNTSIELSERIRLTDLEGQKVKLNTYKGKTVFINFWATWCKPCIEEMPSIEKVQPKFNDKDIVFLLASSESLEEIKEFSVNHPFKFEFLHFENDEVLNIQALPTTFIFNAGSSLVFSETGFRDWNSNESITLLKKITNQHD